ncbi:MAG: 3-deoxy-D-manno-octulosonic acid transferase [Alphaproteobacteria bacterium]|nr:3-deoxy-D-manno-octulosonic acid transferase [Alphaproteobacteria bacterium]
MIVLYIYRILTLLAVPFVHVLLLKRKLLGKEDPQRINERFGKASFPRPEGALIWLHAASVGEAHSIVPLINQLIERFPQTSVLLTTGTVTSAQLMDAKLPERAYHQFVPVDTWPAVSRFLRHWKPDVAIWTESEIWPNLIMMTHSRSCPMALLNARMSLKSYHFWTRLPSVIRPLIHAFDLVCPQSNDDAERFEDFGARNMQMLGNLKHDVPPLPADSKETATLLSQIADRPVWVASSTHSGEETMIAEAHNKLESDHATLLTIIVPRHANRGSKIASELSDRGLNVVMRSRNEPITEQTDIYIADTMGELGIFYRLAGIVFIGGSLVPHGGQNPLEPARLDCALITGPHTANFTAICSELESRKALLRVQNVSELVTQVSRLMRDHSQQETLAQNALKIAQDKQGVLTLVLESLMPLLERGMRSYPQIPKPGRQLEETEDTTR